ncbi:MAG: peptidylprolyl isomerase, partial [Gemmatimonadales bacterium]
RRTAGAPRHNRQAAVIPDGPRATLLAAVALVAAAGPLEARQSAPPAAQDSAIVVERILAVVGTRAILKTHLDEQVLVAFPGRRGLPATADSLRELEREMLQRLVDDELMVQEAERDTTIKVLGEEVTQSVDELIRNARAKYGSEEDYRRDLAASGFQSPDEYRGWLTEQQRRRLLINRLKEKLQASGLLKRVAPTEKEIREFFEKNRGRLPQRPATVSFKQLVVAPRPSDSAKARAFRLADSIATELRKGGDFAAAARRFSMDYGSREQGGSINWVRRGENLDPKFEEAAFSIRPGIISNPVETSFGFHLIQVERAQPAEVQVRHILIMPAVDSVEADSARRLADHLHRAILAGANYDSLQRLYHDRAEEREAGPVPVDQLPPHYVQAIGDTPEGRLAPVLRLEAPADPLRSKYALLLVSGRAAAGEVRLEDVKEQIRRQLTETLTERRYLDGLRRGTYVDLRYTA